MYSLLFDEWSNPIQKVDTIDTALALNSTVVIGNNENQANLLYYAVAGKIYMYEIEREKESELKLEGFQGGEVTYISNRYWLSEEDKDHNFDYFTVATYADGKYKIYLYNTVGGIPTGRPERILEGEGKVLKMHFLSPFMGSNDSAVECYPCHF